MKGYVRIFKDPDVIQIMMLATEDAPGGVLGDCVRRIRPGEGFMDKSYEDLLKHGPGECEFNAPAPPR